MIFPITDLLSEQQCVEWINLYFHSCESASASVFVEKKIGDLQLRARLDLLQQTVISFSLSHEIASICLTEFE